MPKYPGFIWLASLGLATTCCACNRPNLDTGAIGQPGTDKPAVVVALAIADAPPPKAVAKLLGEIDGARMHQRVSALVAFGTRHTLSEAEDPARAIAAARTHIAETMRSGAAQHDPAAPLQVHFDSHRVAPDGARIDREVDVVNVVAVLPGTMPEAQSRHYYVIAHYDSRASDPMDATSEAPGANDDASGVAVVMELAQVMSHYSFDATLVFMATAGEEQGLIGADRHAQAARAAGKDVRAVLSNDIVGDPSGAHGRMHAGEVRVFSASLGPWLGDDDLARLRKLSATSDGPSRQLARFVAQTAAWQQLNVQPKLVFRADRFLRGGDHTAFNRAGYAAIRFTEVEENYDRQHQDIRTEGERSFGDLARHVDPDYLAGVARLNAATLAHLANAPSPPGDARIVAAQLDPDTLLRWSQSPEPDVAGYEVLWRDTTAAQWQYVQDFGLATQALLPLSKDNLFFGLRAYDHEGYRSPVAFAAVAKQ